MKNITSRRNPLVKRYRAAALGSEHEIVLDGAHLIDEAVQAGISVRVVACSPRGLELAGIRELIGEVQAGGADCWSVTDDVMRAISPVRTPSGAVALAGRPQVTLERALEPQPALAVVAIDVQDPGNVGAMVRAAEAAGATAMVLAGRSADPFGWKALRGSMGSSFRLPVARAGPGEALATLRTRGVRTVATSPRAPRSLFESDLRGPVALIVGAEGAGLPEEVIARADETVRIPMREPVESLNVAVATALLVYEASRQRGQLKWSAAGSR